MKHSVKIVSIILLMFIIAQILGLLVIQAYSPEIKQVTINGTETNITNYHLPYGFNPPTDSPELNIFSIISSFVIVIVIVYLLMKYKIETFLRVWFFTVISLALGTAIYSIFPKTIYYSLIALLFAIVLAYFKVFRRNIILHNVTELLIYPGIAALLVPLLNIWTTVLLFIFISAYDIYAVWHTGFMQKMAKYQIKTLRVFSGFFVPYMSRQQKQQVKNMKKSDLKKVKVNVAILGGGDVIFPILLAGTVLRQFGFAYALLVSLGATLSLLYLFYTGEKGKAYPAMPYITVGSFLGLGLVYLLNYI